MSQVEDRTKGKKKMLKVNAYPPPEVKDNMRTFTIFPLGSEVQPDRELDTLLIKLTPETP